MVYSLPTDGGRCSVMYLGDRDGALLCQFFFGLLAGVGVAEVRVEVFVQDLCCLLVEVPSFPSAMRALVVSTLIQLCLWQPP